MTENNCCTPSERVTRAEAEEVFSKPRYHSVREDHDYRVEVFLPGVAKADVNVAVEDLVLTVTAVRKLAIPDGWRILHEELAKPNYRLQLRLHSDIDQGRINASVEDGVLKLVLPIREAAKPRTIDVV